MNSSVGNTAKNNFSSFMAAPVSVATNAVKSIKNTTVNVASNVANSDAYQSVVEPLKDSYNSAVSNGVETLFTIPVVVGLGSLIVFFILFIVFRDQILWGFETGWLIVKRWFTGEPTYDPVPLPSPQEGPSVNENSTMDTASIEKILPGRKEVFNVSNNKYNYQDAGPVCKAFGAELATYDQVKEAWSKGADWCNYGWIKGQAAVYPTQEATYEKLQEGPEDQRMACGVPGLNGGYFDNPDLKFGVNCYGTRPNQNDADARHKLGENGVVTPDGIEYNRKVQQFKAGRSDIAVNPFNEASWSG